MYTLKKKQIKDKNSWKKSQVGSCTRGEGVKRLRLEIEGRRSEKYQTRISSNGLNYMQQKGGETRTSRREKLSERRTNLVKKKGANKKKIVEKKTAIPHPGTDPVRVRRIKRHCWNPRFVTRHTEPDLSSDETGMKNTKHLDSCRSC